jgi:hypothetical protein
MFIDSRVHSCTSLIKKENDSCLNMYLYIYTCSTQVSD